MRILSFGPKWAKVRATHQEMLDRAVNGRLDPSRLGSSQAVIQTDGSETLMYTYAKAYYRGGGVWLISGYKQDSSDVMDLIYGGQK